MRSFLETWARATPAEPPYYVGVDLGQASDPTAITISELTWPPGNFTRARDSLPFEVRHIERMALRTSYVDVFSRVHSLISTLGPRMTTLVVDATGVGRVAIDELRAQGLKVLGVTITGGDAARVDLVRGGWDAHVPKRDLVTSLAILVDQRRLRIANRLALGAALFDEMSSFAVRARTSGHETFGARSGKHDDLVLSLAMAAWACFRPRPTACMAPLDTIIRRLT